MRLILSTTDLRRRTTVVEAAQEHREREGEGERDLLLCLLGEILNKKSLGF